MSNADIARQCARGVRGCTTDDQYVDLLRRIEDALDAAPRHSDRDSVIEECARECDLWLNECGYIRPLHVSAHDWATGAVADIADAIRSLKSTDSPVKGEEK